MDFSSIVPFFGNAVWALLFFVVALSIIVTVHELGHYLVGRWTGIGAEVFSVGFGPVIFSRRDRRGTRWQIAAIPFGGYVKFLGDSGAASGRDSAAIDAMPEDMRRHTVHGAPLWARAATVAAGPVFNFILSILVFGAVLLFSGVPRTPVTVEAINPLPASFDASALHPGDQIVAINGQDVTTDEKMEAVIKDLPETRTLTYTVLRDGAEMQVEAPHLFPPRVEAVMQNSAAEDSGLEAGDVILSVDGTDIDTFGALQERTAASGGNAMLLKVWRDGKVLDFTLKPRSTDLPTEGGGFETRYLIGLNSGSLFQSLTETPGPGEAISYGARQTWDVIVTSISGIWHIATGRISSCNLQSPIGIAKVSGHAAAAGLSSFIMFIAFLSTAVGLLNLFPVPVLDGGHLVFHAWEAVTGKAPTDRALRVLMGLGLVLLLALMIFAVTNDLGRCP